MMSRLFFALWPDDKTRERMFAICRALPDDYGRRVVRQNLHLTLAFLGGVDEETKRKLLSGAASIHSEGFSLAMTHLGWFKRAQVLWLAPDSVPDALLKLVAAINSVVSQYHLKVDKRPYAPHLTLVRKAQRAVRELSFEPIYWNINHFCLVESDTRPEGAEYKIIGSWPLS